ncbi:hypothetical protein [Novosphingobium sp.]|uniref:hypothetical protein n=1 Tax=Novosphingobium sp. TaxID=1874826 RepID=UPI001ECEC1F0|nr:hypothetical protein [Novosphingobium sp.]MBK6800953.1 hypothetical protein [Novosphingobium sp.]MBK9011511.1 hypothetical protein [Novosphingobium sp.]
MTKPFPRFAVAGIAAALSLLLTACLISPGKFTSALDLRKDGRFSYSYQGEIYMLGLGKLAEMGAKADAAKEWEATPCTKEDSMDERPCTKDELAQQKSDWEAERAAKAEKDKRDAEMAKAMMGGIDPSDPRAAEEFATRLRRQAGWKSVVYKGDGMYIVDFAITGRIDHDFAFPTIERFPMANPFVMVNRRADGSVRVDAPGFGPASNGGGMNGLAQLAAMGAMSDKAGEGGDAPKLPVLEGTFTLTTDGQILANNTDEGPVTDTTGSRLEWKVTPRTAAAPTALIKLVP